MTDPFLLYISAAADLSAERELLSRTVAEMPIDIGWRIVVSPSKNQPLNFQHISQSDFHILLLAEDIRAPVGLEFQWAAAAGRMPAAFLKSLVNRTPAANAFKQYVSTVQTWQPFESGRDLLQAVVPRIVDRILERSMKYRLTPVEQETLIQWRREIERGSEELDQYSQGGASDGSLIFSIDSFRPSNGIRLDAPEEPEDSASPEAGP